MSSEVATEKAQPHSPLWVHLLIIPAVDFGYLALLFSWPSEHPLRSITHRSSGNGCHVSSLPPAGPDEVAPVGPEDSGQHMQTTFADRFEDIVTRLDVRPDNREPSLADRREVLVDAADFRELLRVRSSRPKRPVGDPAEIESSVAATKRLPVDGDRLAGA